MRPFAAAALILAGCSSPYHVRLSDERSVSAGPLFFFGWADPALIPGTRLIDAPPGSRLVLWNPAGLEAIVDVGDTCPVLVCEDDGARAPTELELEVIAAVFEGWPVVASTNLRDYAAESRLERRFPSHIRAHVVAMEAGALLEFSLGDEPAAWLARGGRVLALSLASDRAPAPELSRVVTGALALEGEGRREVLRSLLKRTELVNADLVRIARIDPVAAAAHPAADEAVCLAAVEAVSGEPLSSLRRKGLEGILASPAVTARVRERILEVPLAYPEDRTAVRQKCGGVIDKEPKTKD